MKNILVLGAGKSASTIIAYLLSKSEEFDWQVTVGDLNLELAQHRINGHARGRAISFNVKDEKQVNEEVSKADVVASLLPAVFHNIVAKACLANGAHLVTASYVDAESKAMHADFEKADLLFMGEIGLDPGIDHLGLMKILNELRAKKAKINGVHSHCGALIHPEDDNNPWKYKFTWAPMNVVKAGQGVSMYLHNKETRYVPYSRLFSSYRERNIGDLGDFEIYPNRDSAKYLEKYSLNDLDHFMRGTIRKKGYCDAWNAVVQLGLTDDSYQINAEGKSYSDLLRAFIPLKNQNGKNLREATADFLGVAADDEVIDKLAYLELFDDRKIELTEGSPAAILCQLLQDKWQLEEDDRDMIVMLHEVDYELNGETRRITANMTAFGEDEEKTAISKTVGLPSGMMVKLIATDQVKLRGVRIPVYPEVYEPILQELEEYDIVMHEHDAEFSGSVF